MVRKILPQANVNFVIAPSISVCSVASTGNGGSGFFTVLDNYHLF